MNRLTTKIKGSNNYCEFELKNAKYKNLFELSSNREIENYVNTDLTLAIDKLGKLEDIEEELGIDLITLFKALKNGVYHFASDGVLIHDYGWLEDNYFYPEPHDKLSCSFRSNYEDELFYFKDYGKTWSIDKKDFMKKENKNDWR